MKTVGMILILIAFGLLIYNGTMIVEMHKWQMIQRYTQDVYALEKVESLISVKAFILPFAALFGGVGLVLLNAGLIRQKQKSK